MNKTSRQYQNLIHTFGSMVTVLTVTGVMLIGKDKFIGVIILVVGGILTRFLSEIEYIKQEELFKEYNHE